MKRHANLIERIACRETLRRAVQLAARGKRHRWECRLFAVDLERNLQRMGNEISTGTAGVGQSRQFVIHDPKRRLITAPCFAERVLHHAIMLVCEPIFEGWLINDTFACRRNLGRIAALHRAQQFSRQRDFYLKFDIRQYFDSISHAVLLNRLGTRIKDTGLLQLFERIVTSYRPLVGRGLPIGSLTSQHFANFYLGWFDRFVKEQLRCRGYLRYMDDMVMWGQSPAELQAWLARSQDFLRQTLNLELKLSPYINRCDLGIDFLGSRVFPQHLTLNRRSKVRAQRRLANLERMWIEGKISEAELQRRATSVIAFVKAGGCASWKFRRHLVERSSVSDH